ncbi:ribosome silencing factor [Alphaproteobacteria bacterium 46_93_T64]|nr:ribosome silencing factor [Alphaproteobacteria bacterium 46_93_T64]
MNAKLANASKLRDLVQSCLEDNKAEQVVSIDLSGKTSFADYMVIANGRSTRQVGALADHLKEEIRDAGFGVAQIEGKANCDWVLVDAGDVIVHLFRPEVRDFYNLEKIWAPTAAKEMSN